MLKCKRNLVLGTGLTMVAALLVAPVSMTANAQSQEVETGYLVSVRGKTLSMSNIPMDGGRSSSNQPQMRVVRRGGEPDGFQRMTSEEGKSLRQIMKDAGIPRGTGIMVTEENGKLVLQASTPEGKPYELTPEQKKAIQDFEARNAGGNGPQGGGMRIEVTEENGEQRYKLTGPDGKTKMLTEEEFKEMEKKMEHGGGMVRMRAQEDGAPRGVMVASSSEDEGGPGKVMKREKVKFSRFEITDETEIPDGIGRGTQIKVHYRVEGSRKIATKVEAVI